MVPQGCPRASVCLSSNLHAGQRPHCWLWSDLFSPSHQLCFLLSFYVNKSQSDTHTLFRGLTSRLLVLVTYILPRPFRHWPMATGLCVLHGAPRQDPAGTSPGNSPVRGFFPFPVTPGYAHLTHGETESQSFFPQCTRWQGPRCA